MSEFDPFAFLHKVVDRLPTHENDRAQLHQELNEAQPEKPEDPTEVKENG